MATTTAPLPPRQTANPAPVRPARSIRRTSSIDVTWPDGEEGERLFVGHVRDFLTPADGGPGRIVDEGGFRARLAGDKTITAITAEPPQDGIESLVGVRGGNHLRLFIKETMPELIARAKPLYLALDDISGSALVSAFAWSQWHPDWHLRLKERIGAAEFDRLMASRANVCWGLRAGNSGVTADIPADEVAQADAGDLRNPADPDGWHPFHESDGPAFRRARRIDVTRDGAAGMLRIDSSFQDSVTRQDGSRLAIHEYNLRALADARTLEILEIDPEPRILPYWECPGAVGNTGRLIGTSLSDLRETVIAQLRGTDGCTHLNDAMRALAEVPRLAEHLEEGVVSG